jgi:uncharacterized protein
VRRVVIDPGVLVAALISPKGAPRALLRAWIEGAFELIVSSKLLSELERVLKREKFRSYVGLREVKQYLALLRRFATIAPDVEVTQTLSPDPDDDYLITLAASQSATSLVSGDTHLTDLKQAPIPVLTPRAFLDELPLH